MQALYLSQLDGRSAKLAQCPEQFKIKYRVCVENIKTGSPSGEAIDDLVHEGERCHLMHPLDVVEEVENDFGFPTHSMSLLAYAVYCRNRTAEKLLMDKEASVLECNADAGGPLFQVMAHCHSVMLACCHAHHQTMLQAHASPQGVNDSCWHSDASNHDHSKAIQDCCYDHHQMTECSKGHNVHKWCSCYQQLDDDAAEFLINSYCAKALDKLPNMIRNSDYDQFPNLHLIASEGSYPYSICYMAFALRQTNNAKLLIRVGADFMETKSNGLPSYLKEYCTSGKFDYLSWLVSFLSTKNLNKLIRRIATANQEHIQQSLRRFGRNPVHALLLSGNEHTMRIILETEWGPSLLGSVDQQRRTPLHIAADMGHEEYVKMIVELGADVTALDEERETPLRVAARKGHHSVTKCITSHLMERLKNEADENAALQIERFLLEEIQALISQENSDPHEFSKQKNVSVVEASLQKAAESRNTRAIRAIARYFGVKPTIDLISCAISTGDLEVIELLDLLCNENASYNRIDALLEACWSEFSTIKGFYYNRLSTEQKKEALYLASARGNDIALDFLISKKVDPNRNRQGCPLLVAAARGHVKCVVQLLEAKADVCEIDDKGNNCLMIAIERKHEAVVKAILEHANELEQEDKVRLFKHRVIREDSYLGIFYTTPLRMLIKDMPVIAKQFLDSCVVEYFEKGRRKIDYDVQYIDDFDSKWAAEELEGSVLQKKRQNPKNHVIWLMVNHKRLELLNHPLVSEWIQQKWQRAQAVYYSTLAVYCVLLTMLTAFATVSPKPPQNAACAAIVATVENITSICNGSIAYLTQEEERFLYVAGAISMISAALNLGVELQQLRQLRISYFTDWQNYLQLFVYVGTIVFISVQFDAGSNYCWCVSDGIWQLGAAVVMCSWSNFILLLKDYPFYGIGGHITLLYKICLRYLKLVYLPILLMASFGFSFSMLLTVSEGNNPRAFSTPWWSLASTFFGTTGFDSIFVGTAIAYPAMGIILFTVFYVVVTVLFTNMLIGLSTSDAQEALKEAKLISIANQVYFILLVDDAFPQLKKPFVHCKSVGGNTESADLQNRDYCLKKMEQKIYKQRENGATSKDILQLKNLITDQQRQLQSVLRNQEALREEIKCLARRGL